LVQLFQYVQLADIRNFLKLMNKETYSQDLNRALHRLGNGASAFSLKYQVVQGRAIGPGAYYNQEDAVVDGSGNLLVFRRRDMGENALPAPGKFQGRLDKKALEVFLKTLHGLENWGPSAQTPSPTDPFFRLTLVLDGAPHKLGWGPLDPEERTPRAQTLQALSDLFSHASLAPVWSLSLQARDQKKSGSETHWTLALKNEGTEPVVCVHPGAPLGWAPLQVTAADIPIALPGVTPLPPDIEIVDALTPGVDAPWLISVAPGSELEFAATAVLSLGANLKAKISYSQWALPEAFAGQAIFQGEVFSEEFSC
jgi:hypothetical protein